MGRVLTVVGKVWLYLAAAIILFGGASLLYFEGWGKLLDTLSAFNIWNWLAVVIMLLPGIGLVELGKKLDKRASRDGQVPYKF